jgi:hypothetical protein
MNTDRKPISAIVAAALEDITEGAFSRWPSLSTLQKVDSVNNAID